MTRSEDGVVKLGRLLLHDVDVVSFDFFDTLVHRPSLFAPTGLFNLIEGEATSRGLAIKGFASIRVRAEGVARVRSHGNGVGDVTLAEIYREVGVLGRIAEPNLSALMALELDLERRVLERLPSGHALYREVVGAGKRVVIVSDTYFSVEFLAEIAERAGYDATEQIFASSAARATKSDGGLFEFVVEQTGVEARRIVHVGDDAHSDYRGALGRGLKAVLTRTPIQTWKHTRSVPNRTSGNPVLDELFRRLATSTSPSEPGGTAALVPEVSALYLGQALWLAWRLAHSNIRTAYFFSRDGRIMKEFFDLVASAAGLDIDSRYLYVSRAALYPTVISTAPMVARRLFAHNWEQLPISDALRRVGLEPEECEAALRANGLRSDAVLGAASRDRFEKTLIGLWPVIERRNASAGDLAIAYLEQEGVLTSDPAAFVDIGWHGTMQNAILLLCRHKGVVKPVQGFYVGTFADPVGADPLYRASGFLVDHDDPPHVRSIVRASPSLIELLHGASHGSVEGYEVANGRIDPVLNGELLDCHQYETVIGSIQSHAKELAESVLDGCGALRLSPPDAEMVARVGLGWLTEPAPAVAEALGALKIVSDVRGIARSITGAGECNLAGVTGELLSDGSKPMWPAGRRVLLRRSDGR